MQTSGGKEGGGYLNKKCLHQKLNNEIHNILSFVCVWGKIEKGGVEEDTWIVFLIIE